MSEYKILRNIKTKETKAIRIGWSWQAFFMNIIWALHNGLVFIVLYTWGVIVTLSYVLNILTDIPQYVFIFICVLPVPFIYGFLGNNWLSKRLTTAYPAITTMWRMVSLAKRNAPFTFTH